jgi:gentisate 1,2-dioxygenase
VHQTTASTIFAVVEGAGRSEVDGQIIDWSRGDVFVAPNWLPHRHTATIPSVLLRVSDEPALAKLDLLRERTP